MGVNSVFVDMTCENPISFYCKMKIIIIIIIIIIKIFPRPGNTGLMSSVG